MSKARWQALADFFNEAEITPESPAPGDKPFPCSMYNEEGTWGISYKFNGGNPRWFVVAGPNLPELVHYNRSTGVNDHDYDHR